MTQFSAQGRFEELIFQNHQNLFYNFCESIYRKLSKPKLVILSLLKGNLARVFFTSVISLAVKFFTKIFVFIVRGTRDRNNWIKTKWFFKSQNSCVFHQKSRVHITLIHEDLRVWLLCRTRILIIIIFSFASLNIFLFRVPVIQFVHSFSRLCSAFSVVVNSYQLFNYTAFFRFFFFLSHCFDWKITIALRLSFLYPFASLSLIFLVFFSLSHSFIFIFLHPFSLSLFLTSLSIFSWFLPLVFSLATSQSSFLLFPLSLFCFFLLFFFH